ncbi:hypothetical protein KFE98_19665 [bacterium SCSIO 12741]|nr:hypothetical protein KFE98_19665 [bacterium SCSIO 12741]
MPPMWYDKHGTLISRSTKVTGLGAGEYHLVLPFISSGIRGFQYHHAFSVHVGNKVLWESDYTQGLTVQNELDLIGGQASTDYYAVSRNRVSSTEDAWISFEVPQYRNVGSPSPSALIHHNKARIGFTEAEKASVSHVVARTHGHYLRLPSPSSSSSLPNGIASLNGVFSGVNCYGSVDPALSSQQQEWKIERTYHTPGGGQPYYTYTVSSPAGQKMEMTVDLAACQKTDQTLRIGAILHDGPSQIHNIITSMGCEEITSYHELMPELEGDYRDTYYGHFFFRYEGEYNHGTLDYELTDIHGNPVNGVGINTTGKDYGDNRYVLDMNSVANGFYLLTVTNEKKENYYLRIKKEL